MKHTYIRVNGIVVDAKTYRKAHLRDRRVRHPAVYKAYLKRDSDKDGIENAKDCEPFNKKKQGRGHKKMKAEDIPDVVAEAARKRFMPTTKEKLASQRRQLQQYKKKEQIRKNEAKLAELKAREKEISAEKRAQQIQRVKSAAGKVTGLFRRKKKSIYAE